MLTLIMPLYPNCDTPQCVPGKPVVIMTLKGSDPSLSSLYLYSHTDVVPTFKEHWKHDPYSAYKDENGDIYARGAQDMKCVGIQYLEAIRKLRQLKKASFLRTVHIVWGPDEEIGGKDGMKSFVETREFSDLNVGFALDEGIASPDGTYMIFNAERCIWWVKIACEGNPGHGSKFIDNNAAEKLQSVINSALEFREMEKARLIENTSLTLGDVTTLNLTKIEGGVQLNVIPAEFCAYFDIRIPPTADFEKMEARIKNWCRKAGYGVTYNFLQFNKFNTITSISNDNIWWKTFSDVLKQLNLKYKVETFCGATDSRFLRQRNYKALSFSPMINTEQRIHEHNEFLNEQVFLQGVDIYMHLISRLANVPYH